MKFHKNEARAIFTSKIKQVSGRKSKEMDPMGKEVIHIKISERGVGFQVIRKF